MVTNEMTEEVTGAAKLSSRQQRLDSVLALVRQYQWEEGHSRHVTALALSLFDQLRPLHGLDRHARELLQYAGYLHDVGYQVSVKGHHKHSYRIIIGSQWPAFVGWEVQVLAATARYHRRRLPKAGDRELVGLTRDRKHLVRVLAGILRVADGSDRTHLSLVRRIRAQVDDETIRLELVAQPGAEMELYFAQEKSDLLAVELGRKVTIVLEPVPDAAGE